MEDCADCALCLKLSLKFCKLHRTEKKGARRRNFWDGSLEHREMEVISEVSFRNRNCHDSPQRKLKGTDSPVSPSTVAQERPSVPQVGAHLGRRAVLGLKNTVTSH